MCKTRSKDNNATATAEQTVAHQQQQRQQQQQQQPSLVCNVVISSTTTTTTVPVVAAEDATTMQQILSRDQRTTYHRLIGSSSNSGCATTPNAARTPPVRQPRGPQQLQPQPQQQQPVASSDAGGSSVNSSTGCCQILGLIGDSVPWCLSRAAHHEQQPHQRRQPHTQSNHHNYPSASAYFVSGDRERKASCDVEQQQLQSQSQLQRTCKVQCNSCEDSEDDNIVVLSQNNNNNNSSSYCQQQQQPPSASSAYRNKSLISFVTWLRLVGLLVALSLVSVESAPTAMTLESRRLDQAPKWLNPCGFAAEEFEGDFDVAQLNDATLLGNIVMQAKTALNYAHGFRDDFIKKTFNTDFADLHVAWKDNHYDWLPGTKQIPKMLGENLDKDYLQKLEVRMLDTALLDAYEYMQRYAVGLEQIAWDQEDNALDFRKQFKDTEYNLRSVLCELQMALAERGVTPRADVTREVMPMEFRDISESATFRNLRDWLIFRDYMNGLEYVVQVFEHFIRCFETS